MQKAAYRAVLLGGGSSSTTEHASDSAGTLGGAARASVSRVVAGEEGSNGLKLQTNKKET